MYFDFVAIDFETANTNMNSACSIGLVEVKNNKIVNSFYSLIQPPTLQFDEKNIEITNIHPEDVKNVPKFPDIWNDIKHYFTSDNIITAYNATFDMDVLKNCLLEYDLTIPNFEYVCAMDITNKICPTDAGKRSLEYRCKFLDVSLENNHNALCDATSCAEIVIKTMNIKKSINFTEFFNFLSQLNIKNFYDLKPYKVFPTKQANKFNKVKIKEISPTVECFDENNDFFNKSVVLTGDLNSFSRKDAMQKVVNLGGTLKSTVSKKVDYVIVGKQDKTIVGEDGLSSKEKRALELINDGYDIKIINESEFLKIITRSNVI